MRWREVRDEAALWGELRPELAAAVKAIVEGTMEDELTVLLAARPYERTAGRTGYRNGAFARRLTTELGAIDVRVPRARALAYQPSFLERAARRTAGVDRVLRRAFLRGLSVRETAALAGELTRVPLSAAAVSRLAVRLDAQVAAFHHHPLAFPARYLLIDVRRLTYQAIRPSASFPRTNSHGCPRFRDTWQLNSRQCGDGPQLCQERAFVAPSMAMQNDGDGHDTDFGPAPVITIAGADHELPL